MKVYYVPPPCRTAKVNGTSLLAARQLLAARRGGDKAAVHRACGVNFGVEIVLSHQYRLFVLGVV